MEKQARETDSMFFEDLRPSTMIPRAIHFFFFTERSHRLTRRPFFLTTI